MLIACGPNESKETVPVTEVSPTIDTITPSEEPKSVNPSMAMMVKEPKPACGVENDNQLIYSIDEQTFYTCQGNDWTAIEIKGNDGVDGVNGVDGIDGVDGLNGANGVDGKNQVIRSWTSATTMEAYLSPGNFSMTIYFAQIVQMENGYIQVTIHGDKFSTVYVQKGCVNALCSKTFKYNSLVNFEIEVQVAYPDFRIDDFRLTARNDGSTYTHGLKDFMYKD